MLKIIFSVIAAITLSSCSSSHVAVKETKSFNMDDIESMQFVQGMKGAENIYLPGDSTKAYITDLAGHIYLLDKDVRGKLEIKKSLSIGKLALGITEGKDGNLYVNASSYGKQGWLKHGGEVFKVDTELTAFEKITGAYQGINGLTVDAKGSLYFTAGNLKFFSPKGEIYKIPYNTESGKYGKPLSFIDKLGSANGIFYSKHHNALLFTETFSKTSAVNLTTNKVQTLFGKTKMAEGFDDLCVDTKGRIWVTEPVRGFIKMLNPADRKLTRFHIHGLGLASSCQTRTEAGKEYIYVTEREISRNNDGRGIVVLLIDELLKGNKY